MNFNDSYDCVILPYNHRQKLDEMYDIFKDEFYSSMVVHKPFQSEGIIYRFNYSKDVWSEKIQWECIDSDTLMITCSCASSYGMFPEMTLFEGMQFPIVSHNVRVPEFWFKFRLSDRCMFDFKAQIEVKPPDTPETAKKFLTPDVQRDILDRLIYDNKFELQCVNLLMFVFWCASKSPESVIHDPSEDSRRSKQQVKQIKNHHGDINRTIPLVRKKYNVIFSASDILKIKRSAPDHMVHVRGHWRHYKDGTCIWISPFTKYNDKPDTKQNTYII